MRIAIGTLKVPKIDGIKQWVNTCPYFEKIKDKVEYILLSVPSDISDMPLSIDETMQWAKNRAQNVKKEWILADYYVGIEGWTTIIWDKKYIGWIVYVENNMWEWHFGFSPMLEVPEYVAKKLYEEKMDLGPLMSELSGITNIASQNGSLWAWSDDMFTRKDEFSAAFQAAIAPFFNKYYQLK